MTYLYSRTETIPLGKYRAYTELPSMWICPVHGYTRVPPPMNHIMRNVIFASCVEFGTRGCTRWLWEGECNTRRLIVSSHLPSTWGLRLQRALLEERQLQRNLRRPATPRSQGFLKQMQKAHNACHFPPDRPHAWSATCLGFESPVVGDPSVCRGRMTRETPTCLATLAEY